MECFSFCHYRSGNSDKQRSTVTVTPLRMGSPTSALRLSFRALAKQMEREGPAEIEGVHPQDNLTGPPPQKKNHFYPPFLVPSRVLDPNFNPKRQTFPLRLTQGTWNVDMIFTNRPGNSIEWASPISQVLSLLTLRKITAVSQAQSSLLVHFPRFGSRNRPPRPMST